MKQLSIILLLFVCFVSNSTQLTALSGSQSWWFSDKKDQLIISPANQYGVSVNVLNDFKTLNSLQLTHIPNPDEKHALKLVVIKANSIELNGLIELVSETSASIVLLNETVGGRISCQSCSFDGFERISIINASSSTVVNNTLSNLGSFDTSTEGTLTVNGFRADKSVAVEFISNSISTGGEITTNARANKDTRGGFTLNEQGQQTVAMSGLNFYTGDLDFNYDGSEITATRKNVKNTNQTFIVNGQFNSAAISLISAKNIEIAEKTKLNTQSDIVMSGTYNNELVVPKSGVSIVTLVNGIEYGRIINNGMIATDSEFSVLSANDFVNLGTIVTDTVIIASKFDVKNSGFFTVAKNTDISAKDIFNEGIINTIELELNAESGFYNQFGGKILASKIDVFAEKYFINGSRKHTKPATSTHTPLLIQDNLNSSFKYGVYNSNSYNFPYSDVNLEAKIQADELYVRTKSFENINPYFKVRGNSEIWDDSIEFDYSKAKQVSIKAVSSLQIYAENYVLNSSAIMGLDGIGSFIINTPKVLNERYRVDTQGYIFSRMTQDSKAKNFNSLDNEFEAHVNAYSPMAALYSYGAFDLSPISAGQKTSITNHLSFFQIHGVSNFYNTTFNSVSMTTGIEDPVVDSSSQICLIENCNQSFYTDSFTRTTFTSFLDDVLGLNSKLLIEDKVQVLEGQQILVDAYIAKYKEDNKRELKVQESQHFSLKVIKPDSGDVLIITEYFCKVLPPPTNAKPRYRDIDKELNQVCNIDKHSISINEIMTLNAGNLIIPGTNQTHAQIRAMAQLLIDRENTYERASVINPDIGNYPVNVSGYYMNKLRAYSLAQAPKISLTYNRNFYSALADSVPMRTVEFPETGMNKTKAIDYDTFASTKPMGTTISAQFDTSTKAVKFNWNKVFHPHIKYVVKYQIGNSSFTENNVGSSLLFDLSISSNTTVNYQIKACTPYPDQNGNQTSLCSDYSPLKTLTIANYPAGGGTVPNCPQGQKFCNEL